MALNTKVNVRRITHHPRYRWMASFIEGGKRQRKYFKTKAEAEAFQDERQTEARDTGTRQQLLDDERAAVGDFRERLGALGLSVRDALKMAVEARERVQRSADVATLAAELIEAKEREGKSARYLSDLRSRLGMFRADFGERPVASIQAEEISDWLDAMNAAPITVGNVRRLLVLLFNEGKRRRYCEHNPATDAIKPKVIESEIGILTPAQAARMLEGAKDEILPVVAIGLFAGLREAELKRLDWSEVDLIGGLIEVKASKAKSARRRLVKIQPNLAAWLSPVAKRAGSVWPSNGRKLLEAARRAAGFNLEGKPDWPHNAARHSFASYHLAKFQDAAALALELGHADTGIIFAHYRELVRPAQAETFWKIAPAAADNVIPVAV